MSLNFGDADLPEASRPEESITDIASAAWDNMSMTGTFVESTIDGWKREGLAEAGKPLTPEVINTQFPGLNADRDTTISEAKFIMDKRSKVKENQDIIDSASNSFLKGTVVPFVAGAARAMVDPIDMGINLVTGGLGAGLQQGAKLSTRIGIDAAEAAIAATIAEIPVAMEMNETFEEYTSKQFLTNVIGASILQVGLSHGVPSAYKATSKAVEFSGAKTADNIMKFADVLEQRGINSAKALDSMANKLKSMTSKADEITMSVKNTLGDKVEIGDDMIDSMKNVMKAHEEGVISDSELTSFRDQAIELGVDERVLKQAVDNQEPIVFRDDEIAEIDQINKAKENKQGWNPEAEAEIESMEGFDPVALQDKYIKIEKSPESANLEMEVDGVNANTSQVREQASREVQEMNFFKEFAACKRGA